MGTTTSSEGLYSLNVPSAQAILTFSFVGYESRGVPVEGQSVVDVAVEQKSVTGSVSSVNAEELAQSGNPSTLSDALAGKVAGVNFRKPTGRPGSGTQIQILKYG